MTTGGLLLGWLCGYTHGERTSSACGTAMSGLKHVYVQHANTHTHVHVCVQKCVHTCVHMNTRTSGKTTQVCREAQGTACEEGGQRGGARAGGAPHSNPTPPREQPATGGDGNHGEVTSSRVEGAPVRELRSCLEPETKLRGSTVRREQGGRDLCSWRAWKQDGRRTRVRNKTQGGGAAREGANTLVKRRVRKTNGKTTCFIFLRRMFITTRAHVQATLASGLRHSHAAYTPLEQQPPRSVQPPPDTDQLSQHQ